MNETLLSHELWLGLIAGCAVLIYLGVALIWPERLL